MRPFIQRGALTASLLVLSQLAGAASGSSLLRAQTADEAALASYRLTMPTVRKLTAATEAIYKLSRDNPQFAEGLDPDDEGAKSLADVTARIDRFPEVKRAIQTAGLTTREYVVSQLALFQAAMVVGFQDQPGPTQLKEIPPGISRENVAFVRQNKAEIEQIMAHLKQLEAEAEAERAEEANDSE